MPAETAEEVARRVLDAVHREDWHAYAALIESDLLEQWREERIDAEMHMESIRRTPEAIVPTDAPPEVRTWLSERHARYVESDRLEQRYEDVHTLDELRSLSAVDMFVRALRVQAPSAQQRINSRGARPLLVEEVIDVTRPSLQLVGVWEEGRLAHVLLRASSGTGPVNVTDDLHTFTLGRSAGSWRIVRIGALPGSTMSHTWFGWSPAFYVQEDEQNAFAPVLIDPLPWALRSFPSGLPAGLFPALLARYEANVERLSPLLFSTSRRGRTARPADGKWSIQEHAGHLLEIERLADLRFGELERGAQELSGADASYRAAADANYNEQSADHIYSELTELRTRLVRRLERLTPSRLEHTARHPRLDQPMNVMDLLYFMCEHDDHHLAQMRRLQREHHRRIMEGQ